MKDKDLKLEEVKVPHTLGGSSYVLTLYINSVKEVVSHLEVELYKPRSTLVSRRIQTEAGFGSDNHTITVCVCE
jgi:hypothetical protein